MRQINGRPAPTPEEIAEIVRLHRAWARSEAGGARAYLRDADLQDADLQGADLQGAYLRGADLRGADLQGADLRGADLQGADLQGAYLRGAYLQGAYLQGAYLRGADLQDADLQGADLQGAYLRGADLRGADLQGADLQGAYLQGADLQGADLQGAYLQGADEGKQVQIEWSSHDLISEILRRAAGDDVEKRKVAGLILVSRDWCWSEFLALDEPLRGWALDTLAEYALDDPDAPEEVKEHLPKVSVVAAEASEVAR